MTATNPHPFANPLNQSRFRNYAYGQPTQQNEFSLNRSNNPRDLTVPDARPYNPNAAAKLTVPNQDIPYFNEAVPARGFLGDSSLFKLSDGCVLDLKKCRVVFDPNKKWKDKGYWNNPNAEVEKPQLDNEWGPTESIESMLNRVGKPDRTYNDPNLDPKSIAYWNKANEESKKLEQNLTDEQKQLLADLQAGKMFPLTKLVDEK